MKGIESLQMPFNALGIGSLFCDYCGAVLLLSSNQRGEKVMICVVCTFSKPLGTEDDYMIHQKIAHSARDVTMVVESDEDLNYLPIAKAMCLRCGFNQASYWQSLIEPVVAGDSTLFFRCRQCNYTWREA
ncbi:MAG: RPA12/RPB9/RPC11 RNA polymerase family protein [Candidatus Hodarchaeales archaeon]|jgi:DNA-directed RNA polymerase subunit M/transcription elongation factor TFIIS